MDVHHLAQRCVRLENAGHLRRARPGEQATAWLRSGRGRDHARTVEATKVTWAESGRIRAFGRLPRSQLIPDVHPVRSGLERRMRVVDEYVRSRGLPQGS